MLVPVFLQTAPHVAFGLMASKSSASHATISVVAGATRADMVLMVDVVCNAEGEVRKPARTFGLCVISGPKMVTRGECVNPPGSGGRISVGRTVVEIYEWHPGSLDNFAKTA